MNTGDGTPQTSPSWGQQQESEMTIAAPQIAHNGLSQPHMYISEQLAVQPINAPPIQVQDRQQLPQNQQSITGWQLEERDMGKAQGRVPASYGPAASTSYMEPPTGDLRGGAILFHSNYYHAQEPMASSFSHPNFTQHNLPKDQRLNPNSSTAPHIPNPISHNGSMSSVSESPLGTSFSGPPSTGVSYVPGGPGYYQPQHAVFVRQQLQHEQNIPPQPQHNAVPFQSLQHGHFQPPQGGHFPLPPQQFQGQQQFPSPTQLQLQQVYQQPQTAQHLVPMFPPQQRPQVVMQPGFPRPLPQHQQPRSAKVQSAPDSMSNATSFADPLPAQALMVDDRGQHYAAPRSHSTPNQPMSFEGARTGSFPTPMHPAFEHSYPNYIQSATMGGSAPVLSEPPPSSSLSGFAPPVVGVPQPLSGNYFPHGPPPHATTPPPPSQHTRAPSLSPSPKSKEQTPDATPKSSSVTKRTRRSKKKTIADEKGSDSERYEDTFGQDIYSTGTRGRRLCCFICGRSISRDMSRHMRIHEDVSRFRCIYPRDFCSHKTGYFNRQYDFKKHLLHYHFTFEDAGAKKYNSLNEKLPFEGTCDCGAKMPASTWLSSHIMESDSEGRYLCTDLREKWDDYSRRNDTILYGTDFEDVDPQSAEGDPLGANLHPDTAPTQTSHKPLKDHH